MSHQHHYRLLTHLVLTLPDVDGWFEGLVQYRCHGCGHHIDISGSFNAYSAPFTADDLVACLTRERQEGTMLAKVAQREDALHRQQKRARGEA